MVQELTHFIGGKHIKGTSGRFADAFWPMTGEVASKVPLASKAEVRAAVENAKAAQPAWAATNPQRRARVMFRFKELIEKNMDELALIIASEHGKGSTFTLALPAVHDRPAPEAVHLVRETATPR